MGVLFFEDRNGHLRVVNPDISIDDVHSEIVKYVNKLNPNFCIYYTRYWSLDENTTKFDVGSHVEFFIFKNKCCNNCKHFLGGGDFGTCCTKDYGLHYEDNNGCENWEVR